MANKYLLYVGVMLFTLLGTAWANPYYLTFEVDSVLGSSGVNGSNFIGYQYVFKVDFNGTASHIESDGSTFYYNDLANSDRFYVEEVASNYISFNDDITYFVNSPQQYNLGVWTVFDELKENVYGSGPTYGSFYYQSRISLYTESFDDEVSIDGFWYDQVTPSYPNSLLTPGAKWMIYDRDYSSTGYEMQGSFWASLVNISQTNPTAPVVPEPISTILFIVGGTVLAGKRYLGRKKKA